MPDVAPGAAPEVAPKATLPPIPGGWPGLLVEQDKPYYRRLNRFLAGEYGRHTVYPPRDHVFEALRLTPCRDVRVVLLGQDPYHGPGQAHGLAFSVQPGVPIPPSLRNMYRELASDLGIPPADHGYLAAWAGQGVLLLNAVLTVRAGTAASHAGKGWERFTDAVIQRVNASRNRVVFLLLGGHAQKKGRAVSRERHTVIETPHPSPLSAHRGFFGSGIFSRTNRALLEAGRGEVDWRIPPLKNVLERAGPTP